MFVAAVNLTGADLLCTENMQFSTKCTHQSNIWYMYRSISVFVMGYTLVA
jgi:hypothetical protein